MRQGEDASLDLGVVGAAEEPAPHPDPDPPDSRSGHRRWVAAALAFVVGGVVGLVVADAREEATGRARVELFGGSVLPAVFDGSRPYGELTVTVLNAGDRAVEIVGVVVEGTTIAAGSEAAEPVTAEPGRWVSYVQRDLEVDCDGPLPDAMSVRARTESGEEQLVELEPPDDHEGLRSFWYFQCQVEGIRLQVQDSTVIETGEGRVVLGLELGNTGPADLRVRTVAARAPGFTLTTDAADLSVPAGESVTVTTTWTVRDCRLALNASGGSLAVRIVHGDAETEQIIVLPDAGFVALARLSGQYCPARIQE